MKSRNLSKMALVILVVLASIGCYSLMCLWFPSESEIDLELERLSDEVSKISFPQTQTDVIAEHRGECTADRSVAQSLPLVVRHLSFRGTDAEDLRSIVSAELAREGWVLSKSIWRDDVPLGDPVYESEGETSTMTLAYIINVRDSGDLDLILFVQGETNPCGSLL